MEMQEQYEEIDLREILFMVMKRWRIIVLTFVAALITSSIVSFYVLTPIYEAKTSLFLGKERNSIAGISVGDLQMGDKLVPDYREIIKSRLVSKEVIDELGLDMSIESFQKRVSVSTVKDSRLFSITFQSSDPKIAVNTANALGEVIIKKAKEIVDVENVQVIDRAEYPDKPIKPNKGQNIAIAGILGLMLGVLIAFLLEYLDHTIKSPADVERYLGLNTIGSIPKFEGEERKLNNK